MKKCTIKNMKRRTCGWTAALLAAVVLAGCGGGAVTEEATLARSATTAAEENSTAEAENATATENADAQTGEATVQDTGAEETPVTGDGEDDTQGDDSSTEDLSCALLYKVAAEQAAEGAAMLTVRDTCSFVTKSYRDSLQDFYYASDSEQVYCVCIVETGSEADAEAIRQEFDDALEATQNDMYLTTDEQKVVKSALTGSDGCYVWYLSLSDDSAVVKAAESALKDCLRSYE